MENVFNAKYNAKLDKLEISKKRRKHIFWEFLVKHKIISAVITSLVILSIIDFYLVYSFIKILENVAVIK